MNRSLSFDNFVAALAVLSVNAVTLGCSTKTTPASEKSAPAAAAPPTAAPEPAPMIAASSAPVEQRAAVDAGREITPAPAKPGTKNPSASCGAQGCSPDMKKNGK